MHYQNLICEKVAPLFILSLSRPSCTIQSSRRNSCGTFRNLRITSWPRHRHGCWSGALASSRCFTCGPSVPT